jgi:hypothetical protein
MFCQVQPWARNNTTFSASTGRRGRPHALANQLALELGNRGEDTKDESAIRRGCINAFVKRNKLDSESVELAE